MPSSNTTYTSTPPIPDYVMQIHDAVNAANPSSPGDADDLHHELYTASQQRAESLVSDLEDAISQLLTERDALQYEVDELIIEHEELAEDFDELQEYAEDCLDEVEDLQDALDDLQDEHLGLRGLCGRLLDGLLMRGKV
ncbi:hypothetical protein N0V95_001366 [Ascochyta clinopodiicola]|nr:hypothetical protein N0V95_001366 [Ascochyta clinopodiicola]